MSSSSARLVARKVETMHQLGEGQSLKRSPCISVSFFICEDFFSNRHTPSLVTWSVGRFQGEISSQLYFHRYKLNTVCCHGQKPGCHCPRREQFPGFLILLALAFYLWLIFPLCVITNKTHALICVGKKIKNFRCAPTWLCLKNTLLIMNVYHLKSSFSAKNEFGESSHFKSSMIQNFTS